MTNLKKVEYELFLEGYTIKQISNLVDSPKFLVKRNLNKTLNRMDKEKTLKKVNSLKISFN